MENSENKKKLKKELMWVIAVASLILIVALIFVTQYAIEKGQEERGIQRMSQELEKKFSQNEETAKDLRSKLNKDLVGTYQSKGDIPTDDISNAVVALTLSPDGSVKMQAYDGSTKTGWWASSQKGGIEFVAVGYEGKDGFNMYQVYNSYLIDVQSAYHGHIENAPYFDTELSLKSEKAQMTITLTKDGKAKGEFLDTNEESENNGLTFLMTGSYSANNGFLDITLNSASTHFITFDYGIDGTDSDSGIASVFYEKIK